MVLTLYRAYVDPVKLIKKIPLGMEISGLREKVVKIISDYNLQVTFNDRNYK